MRMVEITWDDAYSSSDWHTLEQAKKLLDRPNVIKSIGYLMAENKNRVVLVGSDGGDIFGEVQVIHKAAIIERRTLK